MAAARKEAREDLPPEKACAGIVGQDRLPAPEPGKPIGCRDCQAAARPCGDSTRKAPP